jgi:hypothetical protein
LTRLIAFVLVAMSGCLAAPNGFDARMGTAYRIDIPHFVVEFLIPTELRRGYGPFRTKVSFENPVNPRFTYSYGKGAYRKNIGGFFLGIKGDFRDWDLTADFFVIKFDQSQHPMRSAVDLAKFTREILSRKTVLANGNEVDDLGDVLIEKIGPYDVVIATRSDQYQVRTFNVKGGGELTESPYQIYCIRLDDEITVSIRVSHDNAKKLSPKWYAESHARIIKIIESMKSEPKKGGDL